MDLIDREDHQKLYLQLFTILKKKIENKEWSVGSQIPTEDELCKMFNVSRVTVRTAVMELVRLGYLKRQQGKGTFIFKNIFTNGIYMQASLREIFLEDYASLSSRVLAKTVMMPVNDLESKLDISSDQHIIFIKRLWTIQNEPVLLQEAHIPYHISPSLLENDIEQYSLLGLFEKKYGIKITNVKNYIEINYLKHDEARLLNLPEGTPASLLNQHFYSGDTPIMYCNSFNKSDRFKFFINLERKLA